MVPVPDEADEDARRCVSREGRTRVRAKEIHGWLAAEPGLSAQAVLSRLRVLAPDRFQDAQLRAVQRAVKAWRAQSARESHPDRRRDADDRPATAATPTIDGADNHPETSGDSGFAG
jgi:hypothetical protein